MSSLRIKLFLGLLLIMCTIGPISIVILGTHSTLQTLILFMIAAIFGKRMGFYIALAYILIGATGLAVFGNYSSGTEKLWGPTAGFIWAFPFTAWYLGWESERGPRNFFAYILNFFKAHLLLFIPGFLVLHFSIENLNHWQTFLGLIPGLFLKCIAGGVFAAYILQKLPSQYSEIKSSSNQ